MSRRAQGSAVWTDREGREARASDTITCAHCNRVVFTHDPMERRIADDDLGGFCLKCMKQTCGPCADVGECTPIEKRLELVEAGVSTALSDRNLERAIARQRQRDRLLEMCR